MYYEHFGLTQAPFKITPNTEFFFSGGNRGPVLEALIYAITRGEGIVKVTGEVGSGKTMLCNMLQSRLPDHVESVYLANPSVAPEEVLHAIAFDLQLGLDRQADRLEVMHALQDYLVRHHAEGKRVVVFIEESQSMPLATLEEIRLLSNLETRNDKLMQIVLFGQPELDETLRRPDIRQLRDRIAHSFRLQPLNDAEVRDYLMFRMRAAGYRGPEMFTGSVVTRIARASSGLTRRINLIADKALLAAFSENTHTLRTRHVQAALRDSEFGPMEPQWKASQPAFVWAALMLVVGLGLGAALYALLDKRSATSEAVAATPAAPAAVPTATAQSPAAAARLVPPTQQPNPVAAASPDTSLAPVVPPPALAAAAAVAPLVMAPVPDKPQADVVSPATTAAAHAVVIAPPAAASAPAPAASPAPKAAPSDLIAGRLDATRQWLNSDAAGPYSIQLFVADNDQQLRNHLKGLPKFIEINDIYMYRSAGQRRPMVNVLWGSFSDRKAAQDEVAVLPASLKANRPYVRALDGIRAEIDR